MQWPVPQYATRVVLGTYAAVQAGATANTKGSWATIASGLAAPASWISIGRDRFTSAGDKSVLMDIGIGGAGSETIVIPDLLYGFTDHRSTPIPVHIPAGATVRARASCGIGSSFLWVRPQLGLGEADSGITVPGKITAYGIVSAASGGTAITPSGTGNTKGSYSQLVASTTAPIHALMVLAQSSVSSGSMTDVEYLIDIAVGGAGSETIIVPDYIGYTHSEGYVYNRSPELYPVSFNIPAGVRIAARCAAMNSSSTVPIEVAVYGFTF